MFSLTYIFILTIVWTLKPVLISAFNISVGKGFVMFYVESLIVQNHQRHFNECQGRLFHTLLFALSVSTSIQLCSRLPRSETLSLWVAFDSKAHRLAFQLCGPFPRLLCLARAPATLATLKNSDFMMSSAVWSAEWRQQGSYVLFILACQHHHHVIIHLNALVSAVKIHQVIPHLSRRFIYGFLNGCYGYLHTSYSVKLRLAVLLSRVRSPHFCLLTDLLHWRRCEA